MDVNIDGRRVKLSANPANLFIVVAHALWPHTRRYIRKSSTRYRYLSETDPDLWDTRAWDDRMGELVRHIDSQITRVLSQALNRPRLFAAPTLCSLVIPSPAVTRSRPSLRTHCPLWRTARRPSAPWC